MATKLSRAGRAHRGQARMRRSRVFGTLEELKAAVRAECERRYNAKSADGWETSRAKRVELFGRDYPPPVWGPSIALLYSGDFLSSWPECEVVLREMHLQLRDAFLRLALFIQQNHLALPAFACTERMMKWGMVFLPEILGPSVFGPGGRGPWGPTYKDAAKHQFHFGDEADRSLWSAPPEWPEIPKFDRRAGLVRLLAVGAKALPDTPWIAWVSILCGNWPENIVHPDGVTVGDVLKAEQDHLRPLLRKAKAKSRVA